MRTLTKPQGQVQTLVFAPKSLLRSQSDFTVINEKIANTLYKPIHLFIQCVGKLGISRREKLVQFIKFLTQFSAAILTQSFPLALRLGLNIKQKGEP